MAAVFIVFKAANKYDYLDINVVLSIETLIMVFIVWNIMDHIVCFYCFFRFFIFFYFLLFIFCFRICNCFLLFILDFYNLFIYSDFSIPEGCLISRLFCFFHLLFFCIFEFCVCLQGVANVFIFVFIDFWYGIFIISLIFYYYYYLL